MALMLKNGAVFVHIPKTGGMWVTDVLTKCGLVKYRFSQKHADMERILHCGRHYPLWHLKKCLRRGPLWHRDIVAGFKFCFVRHPLRWYESFWRYMCGRGWNEWAHRTRSGKRLWHPNAMLDGLGSDDFNEFIRGVAARRPGYVTEYLGWYTTPEMDFIGKQESLVDDLIRVLDVLNENYDEDRIRNWPRVNESRGPKGRPEWDPELRAEVERLEYAALVRYGYAESGLVSLDERGTPRPVGAP